MALQTLRDGGKTPMHKILPRCKFFKIEQAKADNLNAMSQTNVMVNTTQQTSLLQSLHRMWHPVIRLGKSKLWQKWDK